ncbi:serpin B3-like isoform X1 [Stegodyphus dumicola]|uniref:serpin B3-like isoform X1 n=1 Tax=Stegodyphus dumicola TaxID=202533 RepID=UPI0015B04B82|nr:serpin B3-like isoform X1 [Stegodyphus dumicola]
MALSNLISVAVVLSVCCLIASAAPPQAAEDHLKKLATASNNLALNLHQKLSSGSSSNVFFSPFSISTAFGMLYYGARGETAQELRTVLGYEKANLSNQFVHSSFYRLLTESIKSGDSDSYVLNAANAILADKSLQLIANYKREVQALYQASVQDVDFAKDGPKIVEEINDWVKAKTNGKIDSLVDELDASTVLVLLNAVYFKGTWKTEFDVKKTKPQKFYNNGLESEAKEIPMMHITARFPYTAVYDLQALELPYKGENISMLVLLPENRDGLKALEESLTAEKLATIRQQLYPTKVIVSLPKFKVQYSQELSGHIQSLGVNKIFRPAADFSGMTDSKNVYVSQILHKAVVEVNEKGSEAAAVTGIIGNRIRPIMDFTPSFTADHPFLFAIVDKRSDMILFLGRVNVL